MAEQCPECHGDRSPDHPAGVLVISHGPSCALGAAEDARKHADADVGLWRSRPWQRDTTAAERTLLAHLYAVEPSTVPDTAELRTLAGVAVIRRDWRPLTTEETTP